VRAGAAVALLGLRAAGGAQALHGSRHGEPTAGRCFAVLRSVVASRGAIAVRWPAHPDALCAPLKLYIEQVLTGRVAHTGGAHGCRTGVP
jgi:hypothetical protein